MLIQQELDPQKILEKEFNIAIKLTFPDLNIKSKLKRTPNKKHDYQFESCFEIGKILNIDPKIIAQKIIEILGNKNAGQKTLRRI